MVKREFFCLPLEENMTTAVLDVPDVLALMASRGKGIREDKEELERRLSLAKEVQLRVQVKEDILKLWGPRMLNAVSEGTRSIDNRWSLRRTSEETYRQVLRDLLGSQFKVSYELTGWVRPYLKVSWD
jgi:hypothetical protein